MRHYVLLTFLWSLPLCAADIDSNGFIRRWLILGPYGQDGGNNPGVAAQARDYLTDGTITQDNVAPFPGMIVDTNFAIAASTGLLPESNGAVNPTGDPEWYNYLSSASTINFDDVYLRDVDDAMAYACIYVENITGSTLQNVHVGVGSDDGIQVYVADDDVLNTSVARGYGGDTEIQDRSGPFDLPPGVSRVLVKVFEGWGGWGFRLRFEDSSNSPIRGDELAISVEPFGPCVQTVEVHTDPWLREVTFIWENRFSKIEIWEQGVKIAETDDTRFNDLSITGVTLGEHFYEFHSETGEGEDPCDAVEAYAEVVPVWPTEFTCSYLEGTGAVVFEWRNVEGYYDVLKIQEGGNDVLGVTYGFESAQLTGLAPGLYTFELVAELAGYGNETTTCDVEVTGPPPEFLRGNANADGTVNIADAARLLEYLFAEGDVLVCVDTGDVNDDGSLDISDPVAVLRYLFSGSTVPAPGAESCGPDATADGLVQCAYPPEHCD